MIYLYTDRYNAITIFIRTINIINIINYYLFNNRFFTNIINKYKIINILINFKNSLNNNKKIIKIFYIKCFYLLYNIAQDITILLLTKKYLLNFLLIPLKI